MSSRSSNLKALAIFIYLLFVYFSILHAQEDALKVKVQDLHRKINQSKEGAKLQLMDSLNGLIHRKQGFKYDSITKETIEYAYKLDSVNIALKHTSNLISYYVSRANSPHDGVKVFEDFQKRNLEVNDLDILISLYVNGGDAYLFSGAYKEAIPIYNQAEIFALKAEDTISYARARVYKAGVYVNTGEYAKGSKMLSEMAKLLAIKKDTVGLLIARNDLANLYSRMGFFKEAKKERDEIINISLLRKNYRGLQTYFYNASIDAQKTGDEALCIACLKQAYEYGIKAKGNFPLEPLINYDLLSVYANTDSLTKAKAYYENIQKTFADKSEIPFEDAYLTAVADYYIATKDYKKALAKAQKGLNILLDINHTEGIYQTYDQLAKIHKGLNDYENAYSYATKHIKFKDSVNSIQKAKALSYYQTLYETEKRDFKIADQASEISLLDAKNKLNKQWMLFGGLGLLAIFSIMYLVRSQKFSKNKQRLQEKFSQDLINEQEKERVYLARELHDSVGQKLMLLSKTVKSLGSTKAENLANTALEEIRHISRGLHPSNLERMGLTMSINALIYEINSSTDLFFTESIENIDHVLPKTSELHLFRIIQETLSNIVKHSEAKSIKIDIQKTKKTIEVFISDNGKGFDFNEKQNKGASLGMKTIKERARIINTNLNIESSLGKGTVMTLSIPIENS